VQQASRALETHDPASPLHGKRRVEERDHSLGLLEASEAAAAGASSADAGKTGLRAGGARGGIRREMARAVRIPVGDDCERVVAAAIESVFDRKVLVHFEIGGGETAADQGGGALGNMLRVELTRFESLSAHAAISIRTRS